MSFRRRLTSKELPSYATKDEIAQAKKEAERLNKVHKLRKKSIRLTWWSDSGLVYAELQNGSCETYTAFSKGSYGRAHCD